MMSLSSPADDDAMLAEVAAGFVQIAADIGVLSAYCAESKELELGFEAFTPGW